MTQVSLNFTRTVAKITVIFICLYEKVNVAKEPAKPRDNVNDVIKLM